MKDKKPLGLRKWLNIEKRKQIKEIFQALSEGKELTKKQVELWNKYNKKRGANEQRQSKQ